MFLKSMNSFIKLLVTMIITLATTVLSDEERYLVQMPDGKCMIIQKDKTTGVWQTFDPYWGIRQELCFCPHATTVDLHNLCIHATTSVLGSSLTLRIKSCNPELGYITNGSKR